MGQGTTRAVTDAEKEALAASTLLVSRVDVRKVTKLSDFVPKLKIG